jgi:hypothetical protein
MKKKNNTRQDHEAFVEDLKNLLKKYDAKLSVEIDSGDYDYIGIVDYIVVEYKNTGDSFILDI